VDLFGSFLHSLDMDYTGLYLPVYFPLEFMTEKQKQQKTERRKRIFGGFDVICIFVSLFLAMVIVGYICCKVYENEDYSSTVQQLIIFTLTLEAIIIGIIVVFIPKDPEKKFRYVWKEKGGVYTRHILTDSLASSIIFGVIAFCFVDITADIRIICMAVAIWGAQSFYMIFRGIEVINEYMISDK